MSVESVISTLLDQAGGYCDSPAGITNFGLSVRELSRWRGEAVTLADLQHPTGEEAYAIYYQVYYLAPGFANIPSPALAGLLVDSAIAHSESQAVIFLQHALGVRADGVLDEATRAALPGADQAVLYRRVLGLRLRFIGSLISRERRRRQAVVWLDHLARFIEEAP